MRLECLSAPSVLVYLTAILRSIEVTADFKEFKGFLERQTQTETLGMRIAPFFLLFLGDEEKHHCLTTSHFLFIKYVECVLPRKSQHADTCIFVKGKKIPRIIRIGVSSQQTNSHVT